MFKRLVDEKDLYFDFKNDLLTDYDIMTTNQENKFDFFQLDSNDAVLDLYKIFQLKEGNNLANINGIISNYKDDSKSSEIELKFETSISNEIILGPLIVKNYTNNKNNYKLKKNFFKKLNFNTNKYSKIYCDAILEALNV